MSDGSTIDWTDVLARDDQPVEEVFRRLYARGLVDGLPVIPPTAARVRRLYREARLDPVRLVAVVEPAMRTATVYDVAVCAVMAGCAPAHLPVVCAALAATAVPAFNLLGIQTTTGTAAPVIIVNGPIAAAAGVSGGVDCLGGSVHANAAIGRALRLALRIIGGAVPGAMDAATMGQPAKLGLCFAEHEAASPWPPLHVERGFAPDRSAVTLVGASGSVEVVYGDTTDPADILTTIAHSMTIAGSRGSRGLLGGGAPLVLLSPEHAGSLHQAGLGKGDVRRTLWELARLPLERLAAGAAARVRSERRAAAGAAVDAPLSIAAHPDDVLVVVAGGVGIKSTYIPTWGGGTRPVSVAVDGWGLHES